ncbi:hypothetical protein [Rubrivivax gelatinosus]|uniref:PAS domain-containing protein n=1 Tax=Rubrivivax gelatinosus TaxID=28068 RepID=A0A4R2M812_RUBGE|nr:hypothetical protein [Rubrivivax gelatinosus]MBK1687822.1 hypothetical protein [Rubrivivax gelatinosus]TCP03439.1 hypothetical protein EV684_104160 [Rubrivivax gelatinosus]
MPDLNERPPSAADILRLAELRRRAAVRLRGGAGGQGAYGGAAEALDVLHSMASSPGTAEQALALLHELQVYQVELELQAQELRDARTELEEALSRQADRHDHLPAGCLVLDAGLLVSDLNLTAARLLGAAPGEALALAPEVWLDGESARSLRAAAARVDAGVRRAACPLVLRSRSADALAVIGQLAADPQSSGYLLVLTDDRDEARPA